MILGVEKFFPTFGLWMSPSSSQLRATASEVRTKLGCAQTPQQQGRQQQVTDTGFRLGREQDIESRSKHSDYSSLNQIEGLHKNSE